MATNLTCIVIYARISEDKDGQQTATSRKLDDRRAFAQCKGWEIAEEFEGVDESAFKVAEVPSLPG